MGGAARAVWVLTWVLLPSLVWPKGLTIDLPPDSKRCFYEELKAGIPANVEVFVAKGGNLNIHLRVTGPYGIAKDGSPIKNEETDDLFNENVGSMNQGEDFSDSFVTELNPEHDEEHAIYRACLDNKMSHFAHKTVNVAITQLSSEEHEKKSARQGLGSHELLSAMHLGEKLKSQVEAVASDASKVKEDAHSDVGDVADVERMSSMLTDMKGILDKVTSQQEHDRNRLTVHSSLNDQSHNRMVVGSLVETVVFISVSVFQIFFVRNWFEHKRGVGGSRSNWA